MAKVHTVVRKKANVDTDAMSKMFLSILGSGNADKCVLLNKSKLVCTQIKKFLATFKLIKDSKTISACSNSETSKLVTDLNEMVEHFQKEMKSLDKTAANKMFNDLKKRKCIRHLVISGANVLDFGIKYFREKEPNQIGPSKDDFKAIKQFVLTEPGLRIEPLTFADVELKKIWFAKNEDLRCVIDLMDAVASTGSQIAQIMNSPNVDICKFSNLLITEIGKLRGMLKGCDEAFNIIQESVSTLQDNFDQYYRDSIETQNPSVMLENFVSDVLQDTDASLKVASQFKTIVNHIAAISGKKIKDPMVQKMFAVLQKNFTVIDKLEKDELELSKRNLTDEPVVVEDGISWNSLNDISFGLMNLDEIKDVINFAGQKEQNRFNEQQNGSPDTNESANKELEKTDQEQSEHKDAANDEKCVSGVAEKVNEAVQEDQAKIEKDHAEKKSLKI